mgnify:CR=1 FL=1
MIRYNTIYQSKGTITEVKKIVNHPQYVHVAFPFKIDYDIALIHVKDPIDLSLKNVKPVCIPSADDDPADHQTLTVSGWGQRGESIKSPEQLMTVQVPVVSRAHCNDQLKAIHDKTHSKVTQPINERMFCAGTEEGGKGICYVSHQFIIDY